MSHRITVLKDDRVLRETPIGAGLVLGRHPSVDVQLEDPMISRRHARIAPEGAGVAVTDLGSVNGVWINGRKIEAQKACPLRDGDLVRINDYEIRVALDAEPDGFATQAVPPEPAESTGDTSVVAAPPPSPNLEHLLDEGIPVWRDNQEAELVIADIIEETHDVKTYRLVGRTPLLFSYKPGQFVTVKLDIDGKRVNRCYSISSSPSRPHTLEMTVKRVPGGLVSNWLYENAKLGDTIRVKGPSGSFSCFTYPKQKIGCIAGGSGITPIMSMCRWIVDTTADVDIVMLVAARSPQDIIFRKELELMSARHSGMQIFICVSSGWTGTESWTGLTGRVSPAMLKMVMPDIEERHLFMCGPVPFMDAVRGGLKEIGFDTANLYSESFGPARRAPDPDAKVEPRDVPKSRVAGATAPPVEGRVEEPLAVASGFLVDFRGSRIEVRTDGEGSLLDLAEANGVGSITPGCRMGSCLMCKVKKVSGDVRMDDNMLPDDLQAQGYVLTCVGHPTSDLVLEA